MCPKAEAMLGHLLTVTPFPIQLCCKIMKMTDMPSLGLIEFAGEVLDNVRWELRWERGRRLQCEARLQGCGCRARVRCHDYSREVGCVAKRSWALVHCSGGEFDSRLGQLI